MARISAMYARTTVATDVMLRHAYFCISLTTCHDRRRLMRIEFEKAGIDAAFFDAVLVPQSDAESIARGEGVALGRFAGYLSRGELGCYFSHRRLWQMLVDSDYDAFVIMEDDMVLEDGFKATTEAVLSGKWEFDIVRLGPLRPHERSHPYASLGDGRSVWWTKRTALGTGCYTITRRSAKALLEASSRIIGPVDYDLDRCWVHGQKVQLVYPVAAQAMDLPSTIADRLCDGTRHICFRQRWWRRWTKHCYRLYVTWQRKRAPRYPCSSR